AYFSSWFDSITGGAVCQSKPRIFHLLRPFFKGRASGPGMSRAHAKPSRHEKISLHFREYVGLSMKCYRKGKEFKTCLGERQLRGRIGKLLYARSLMASCFLKSSKE